jgi:hypothetical protein
MNECTCQQIRKSGGFKSPRDYYNFDDLIKEKEYLIEIEVKNESSSFSCLDVSWYCCQKCNAIWRLVEPDFPFVGNWSKVDLVADDPNNNLQNNNSGVHKNDYE